MPMYHWTSYRFECYTPGDIIVSAPDIDRAREIALAEYDREYPEEGPHHRERFLSDIEQEPSIETVLFIYGSD